MKSLKELLVDINNASDLKVADFRGVDLLEQKVDEYWGTNEGDMKYYESDEYLYIGLNCYRKYTRFSVKSTIEKFFFDMKISSVLDYGAGIGVGTCDIAELLPQSSVYFYNYPGSKQDQFFLTHKKMSNLYYVASHEECKKQKYDVIYATELFEHIKDPLVLLNELMPLCKKYFVIYNAFGTKAYGHFTEYENDIVKYNPKQMSKAFNKLLRKEFRIVKKFWNGRPTIWERINA